MGTQTFFPERDPSEESFHLSQAYTQLFNDIYRFARELVATDQTQTGMRRRVRYWTALALLRCVMSSPAAAKAALLARIERLTEAIGEEETDYSPYIFDPTDVEATIDVVPNHVVNEGELSFSDNERRRLREFARRADKLKGNDDTKMQKAEEIVRELLREGYKPIVFCRFIASSDYVAEELQKRLKKDSPKLHVISVTGSLSEEEREIRVEELRRSRQRVLVATDCLGEGVNLQDGFDAVLHFDLPWNPNRLEQREGRVDRFGQTREKVKAVLLYGADNPVDGAVLSVLLRKARKIHRTLGIIVPVPADSESVMETVLKALFLRQEEKPQMSLFENEAPVMAVHQDWDRAAEREKRSRTLFAQHAIKPDEVAQELDRTDSVLGDPAVVERFVRMAFQRLGCPFIQKNGYWSLDVEKLPSGVRAKLPVAELTGACFDQPVPEGVTCIGRNHALVSALAEYLFDSAVQAGGNRQLAVRCGVIRSRDVETLTTLLLVRLRFLIKDRASESVAEECIIAGFNGMLGQEERLSTEAGEKLFESAAPSSNLSEDERKHWVNLVIKDFDKIHKQLNQLAEEKAQELLESHRRLRRATRGGRVSILPLLPPDILSVSIIVPQPIT